MRPGQRVPSALEFERSRLNAAGLLRRKLRVMPELKKKVDAPKRSIRPHGPKRPRWITDQSAELSHCKYGQRNTFTAMHEDVESVRIGHAAALDGRVSFI